MKIINCVIWVAIAGIFLMGLLPLDAPDGSSISNSAEISCSGAVIAAAIFFS